MPETRHCAISCGAYSTDGKKCGVKAGFVSGAFKSFYPKSSTSTPSTHAHTLPHRHGDAEKTSIICLLPFPLPNVTLWPVDRPRNWLNLVNQAMSETDSRRVSDSLARGRPLGSESWTKEMAERLGLLYTLRTRGRPKAPTTRGAAK